MTQQKSLLYRGRLRSLIGRGSQVLLVTDHSEQHATPVYTIDLEKHNLGEVALPLGGLDLVDVSGDLFIAGTDRVLYRIAKGKKKATPFGPDFEQPLVGVIAIGADHVGVLTGKELRVLDRTSGDTLQTLTAPASASAAAADPTGEWIAIGDDSGTVTIFERETQPEFKQSDSRGIHEDKVTAILFEPEGLRFLSASRDRALLSTHARGRLEPEDRARSNRHEKEITALIWANDDRFLSGGMDERVKSWERGSNRQPATYKEGIGRIVSMAAVTLHDRPHVAIGCTNGSIQVLRLDDEGKVDEHVQSIRDAYTWAKESFDASDPKTRENAVTTLGDFDDKRSVQTLIKQLDQEKDPTLRALIAKTLAKSEFSGTADLIESSLRHADGPVRMAIFEGLLRMRGADNLPLLTTAIGSKHADLGVAGVEALQKLAAKDDRARQTLIEAINSNLREVREAAVLALESLGEDGSPEADLTAYDRGPRAQVFALTRLYQRELLHDPRVAAVLRRALDAGNDDTRRTAFLVSLNRSETLTQALRSRDAEVHRQLAELERIPLPGAKKSDNKKKAELPKQPKPKAKELPVPETDLVPLLEAIASWKEDTALRGAKALATLKDSRAFGLLLQLSRNAEEQVRVESADALGRLEDLRGIDRLKFLLNDDSAAVRDAAFASMYVLLEKSPLDAVELGFRSRHRDIRQRALTLLTDELRGKTKKADAARGREFLSRALDDADAAIRQEAYKAAINLPIEPDRADALAFVLGSSAEDVRSEVLVEATAQKKQPWGRELLLKFLSDPAPKLRDAALETLLKASEKTDLAPLQAAIESPYPETRLKGVEKLAKQSGSEPQTLLLTLVADEKKEVREKAIDALIGRKAVAALKQSLTSEHPEVRLKAARARARYGDDDAFEPLRELATAPKPKDKSSEEKKVWLERAQGALVGLADLGDPRAVPFCVALLEHEEIELRTAAASTLLWVVPEDDRETLRALTAHRDAAVRERGALALSYRGDDSVASALFDGSEDPHAATRVVSAFQIGVAGEEHLLGALDADQDQIAYGAFRLMILREWKTPSDTPRRFIGALAASRPLLRLWASDAVLAWGNEDEFASLVQTVCNTRPHSLPAEDPEEEKKKSATDRTWKLERELLSDLAAIITFGPPLLAARFVKIVLAMGSGHETAWRGQWKRHAERYADEIEAAKQQGSASFPDRSDDAAEDANTLAFGTYVGLLTGPGSGGQARLRKTAVRRLASLAESSSLRDAILPVLLQAFDDSNQEVQTLCFEKLEALGMPPSELATAAIESRHSELESLGLKLLTAKASEEEANAVLLTMLKTRTGTLANQAWLQMKERVGAVPTNIAALESADQNLRRNALWELRTAAATSDEATEGLRQALESRYRDVRLQSGIGLANLKDDAAFDPLAEMLLDPDTNPLEVHQVLSSLFRISEERAVGTLLEHLRRPNAESLPVNHYFNNLSSSRSEAIVEPLLDLMADHAGWRDQIFNAVLSVSGYDQYLPPPQETFTFSKREMVAEMLFPLRADVFAKLLETSRHTESMPREYLLANAVETKAHWPKNAAVDKPVAAMIHHTSETLRKIATEAYGWRVRTRDASPEPLKDLLTERDADLKFLAAYHLGMAGHDDGMSILQAAVDLADDVYQRMQAIQALGRLADPRVLPLLLRLANEEGHALQESAAEAIGHLGQSDRADEIFELLEKSVNGKLDGLVVSALVGMTHFDTPKAWERVRHHVERQVNDDDRYLADYDRVIIGLGRNDTPETRELLIKLLTRAESYGDRGPLFDAATELFGLDSLEPDYALLQNEEAFEAHERSLKRVMKSPDPARLLELVGEIPSWVREPIVQEVVGADDLPADVVIDVLERSRPVSVRVAAHIVGRHPKQYPTAAERLPNVLDRWTDHFATSLRQHRQNTYLTYPLDEVDEVVEHLLYAAGAVGVSSEVLIEEAQPLLGESEFERPRTMLDRVLAQRDDAAARTFLAEQIMSRSADDRTPMLRSLVREANDLSAEVVDSLSADAPHFRMLLDADVGTATARVPTMVREASGQPIVLPHLIDAGNDELLAGIVTDDSLEDEVRFGAIEGLCRLASEAGETRLAEIGANDKLPEDLRKEAWRARRRSIRLRTDS